VAASTAGGFGDDSSTASSASAAGDNTSPVIRTAAAAYHELMSWRFRSQFIENSPSDSRTRGTDCENTAAVMSREAL
jgi:hypothetical protein